MYNKKMLFDDAARIGASKRDSEKVWKAFGEYLDEVLRMGKGLKVRCGAVRRGAVRCGVCACGEGGGLGWGNRGSGWG